MKEVLLLNNFHMTLIAGAEQQQLFGRPTVTGANKVNFYFFYMAHTHTQIKETIFKRLLVFVEVCMVLSAIKFISFCLFHVLRANARRAFYAKL